MLLLSLLSLALGLSQVAIAAPTKDTPKDAKKNDALEVDIMKAINKDHKMEFLSNKNYAWIAYQEKPGKHLRGICSKEVGAELIIGRWEGGSYLKAVSYSLSEAWTKNGDNEGPPPALPPRPDEVPPPLPPRPDEVPPPLPPRPDELPPPLPPRPTRRSLVRRKGGGSGGGRLQTPDLLEYAGDFNPQQRIYEFKPIKRWSALGELGPLNGVGRVPNFEDAVFGLEDSSQIYIQRHLDYYSSKLKPEEDKKIGKKKESCEGYLKYVLFSIGADWNHFMKAENVPDSTLS